VRRIRLSLSTLALGTLFVYFAAHLPEEATGRFPSAMAAAYGMPIIPDAQWLFHNAVFFMTVLLAACLVYSLNEERFRAFGLAVPLWGLVNFVEHAAMTIKNGAVYPGLFSSLLFAAIAALALASLRAEGKLTKRLLAQAALLGLGLWAASLALIFIFLPLVGPRFAGS
jgi:hypothetical protein